MATPSPFYQQWGISPPPRQQPQQKRSPPKKRQKKAQKKRGALFLAPELEAALNAPPGRRSPPRKPSSPPSPVFYDPLIHPGPARRSAGRRRFVQPRKRRLPAVPLFEPAPVAPPPPYPKAKQSFEALEAAKRKAKAEAEAAAAEAEKAKAEAEAEKAKAEAAKAAAAAAKAKAAAAEANPEAETKFPGKEHYVVMVKRPRRCPTVFGVYGSFDSARRAGRDHVPAKAAWRVDVWDGSARQALTGKQVAALQYMIKGGQ